MKTCFNRSCSYIYANRVRYQSALHIVTKMELKGKNSKSWYIPSFITKAPKNIIASWLRAFFDDESTVEISRKRIRIKSVNKKGLIQASKLLSKLNIYSRITGENIDKTWYLNIYKTDLKRYKDKVGFLHPSKKDKLNRLIMIIGKA